MPASRRGIALTLVAWLAFGCSATSTPSGDPSPASPSPLALLVPSPSAAALPHHEVIAGPTVAGGFDLATDGTVIAWSNGTVDVDAPALWSFDPVTGASDLVYRSAMHGAILANLATHHGTSAFAEVTPRSDGSRTWRLVVVDPSGRPHVLDRNDLPGDQAGPLPMAAISDRGVLWAATHAGVAGSPRCELRYALLADLRPRLLATERCSRTEFWYPRSDGRQFAYGTVEYHADDSADERHVYLVDDGDLDHARRLDTDGQASLPAILDTAVVWKVAPRDMNMFSPDSLTVLDLAAGGPPVAVPFPSVTPLELTTPSIGPRFIVGEDAGGGSVTAWDRVRSAALDVDRLTPADPGFISGTRLSGGLLAWFYTSSAQGGGTREIRWLTLPPG